MGRRKCVVCGEWIEDNSDSVPYKNRYAHKKCFEIAVKASVVKSQTKTKSKSKTKQDDKEQKKPVLNIKAGISEEEYRQKKSFLDAVQKVMKQSLSSKDLAIADNMQKKYRYTWEGMEQTIHYVFDVLEKQECQDSPMKMIPYYYEESMEFYHSLDQAEKHNEELLNEPLIQSVKTIPYRKRENKTNLIDITQIGCE